MDKFAEWLVRHPEVLEAFIIGMGGVVAFQFFRMGRTFVELQLAVGDAQRAASEALGG